jgi:hypothetical protein
MKNPLRTPFKAAQCIVLLGGLATSLFPATTAVAAEDLKTAFEKVCSQVDASQSLGASEIAALIAKVDALRPEMEKSDDPSKKLYLQRLKKCRSVYEFVLESKKTAGK